MPPSRQILDGLTAIANDWRSAAIAWHVVSGVGVTALFLGWRPSTRQAGTMLTLPLASVSLLAWLSGNPFNGSTFAMMTAALLGVAFRLPGAPVQLGVPWMVLSGVLLAAFGGVYPHFLQTESWITYLYAAPLGLIPCPTLSAVIGASLVVRGLTSPGWSLVLSAGGILYGLIGWFRLGVAIDAVLLVGAIMLAAIALLRLWRAKVVSHADG